jgi:hypothetical protein
MPTDDKSTQDSDAIAHQNLQDGQNAQAHSEQSFDARRAFDATNKRVNDLSEQLKGLDPTLLAKIAQKVGIVEDKEEPVEAKTPDVQGIVKAELWRTNNESRIAKAGDAFEKYKKLGYQEEHALRLAEQDGGIMVDTSEQNRQQTVSSADSIVDRDTKPEMPDSLKGIMSPEEFAKLQPAASKVRIIR